MKCPKCGCETDWNCCPKCGAVIPAAPDIDPASIEFPIPASFLTPAEKQAQTVFTAPAGDAKPDCFKVNAPSLDVESVSAQTQPAPPRPQQPIPNTQQKAPAAQSVPRERSNASAAHSPQSERGFYAVPEYDGSPRAAFSRVRKKWLVPAAAAVIFICGMTAGGWLAHRDKPEQIPEALKTAAKTNNNNAGNGNNDDEMFNDLMKQSMLLSLLEHELLPQYGYAANAKAVSYSDADGIISVLLSPQQMTVFRCEDGALHMDLYAPVDEQAKRIESNTYDKFLSDICAADDPVSLTADQKGISLGGKTVWSQPLAVGTGEVELFTCAKQGTAEDAEEAQYIFTDETYIRDDTGEITETETETGDWHALYAEMLRGLPKTEQYEFSQMYLDDDDVLEVIVRSKSDGSFRLYTVLNGAVKELEGEELHGEFGYLPLENRFYTAEGDRCRWYHTENGTVIADEDTAAPDEDTQSVCWYTPEEEVIHNLYD